MKPVKTQDKNKTETASLFDEIVRVFVERQDVSDKARAILISRIKAGLQHSKPADDSRLAEDPGQEDSEHVICRECGGKFRSLRRHLKERHAMTVEVYLGKWSLPRDSQLVAPSLSQRRSKAARKMGLGRRKDGA